MFVDRHTLKAHAVTHIHTYLSIHIIYASRFYCDLSQQIGTRSHYKVFFLFTQRIIEFLYVFLCKEINIFIQFQIFFDEIFQYNLTQMNIYFGYHGRRSQSATCFWFSIDWHISTYIFR